MEFCQRIACCSATAQGRQQQLVVLGLTQFGSARHNDRGNRTQPRDNLSRLIEPPHMSITGGKIAVCVWEAWVVLDREQQLRGRQIEPPADEMRSADLDRSPADPSAWAQAQRRLDMFDRD